MIGEQYYNRRIARKVKATLERIPAVVLVGPRQVGKTTLAKKIKEELRSVYFDLEKARTHEQFKYPEDILSQHENKLVIIDEVQLRPDLFQSIKVAIDERRQAGRRAGHFLLLGSMSGKLMRQTSQSLAGRNVRLHMSGFDAQEIELPQAVDTLWVRGGYPKSFLAENDKQSLEWRNSFIEDQIHRDIAASGVRLDSRRVLRLLKFVAVNQGTILNTANIGRIVEANFLTVKNHLDCLEDLLLIRRLPAFSSHATQRLVKAPKCYVRDSGLTLALRSKQLDLPESYLLQEDFRGPSWEGFVIENVFSVLPPSWGAYYYRTQDGVEMDLVLELPGGDLWTIEIKSSEHTSLGKGFMSALNSLRPKRAFVVHSRQDQYTLRRGELHIEVLPLRELMNELLDQDADYQQPEDTMSSRELSSELNRLQIALEQSIRQDRRTIAIEREAYLKAIIKESRAIVRERESFSFEDGMNKIIQILDQFFECCRLESLINSDEEQKQRFHDQLKDFLDQILTISEEDENQLGVFLVFYSFIGILGEFISSKNHRGVNRLLQQHYTCTCNNTHFHPTSEIFRFYWVNGRVNLNLASNKLTTAELLLLIYCRKAQRRLNPFLLRHRLDLEFFVAAETKQGFNELLRYLGIPDDDEQIRKAITEINCFVESYYPDDNFSPNDFIYALRIKKWPIQPK